MEKKPKQRIIEKAEYIPPYTNRNLNDDNTFARGEKRKARKKK